MVDAQPGVEYASTDYIEFLLTPPSPPATIVQRIPTLYHPTMRMKSKALSVACILV